MSSTFEELPKILSSYNSKIFGDTFMVLKIRGIVDSVESEINYSSKKVVICLMQFEMLLA